MQTITSKDNPKIKEAAKLVQSKKARREKGLFLTEGLRLCMDAVKSGRIPYIPSLSKGKTAGSCFLKVGKFI